jgi:hypothetical protein
MISSMDLFFSRDCADGAGPAVDAASPLWPALFPLVAPGAGVGCEVVLDDAAGASLPAGLLNRLEVAPDVVVVAAPEAPDVVFPPPNPLPRLGNKDVFDDAVVVGAPLVAVVVAPVVAAVLAGAAGLGKLKPPPVDAGVEAPAGEKRLGAAEPDDAALFPPRLKPEVAVDGGCEEAGAADVVPRLNPPNGFAGVEEGVLLSSPPKRPPPGLEACPSCEPGADWFPPPNRPLEGVDAGAAALFASPEAPVFPPRLKPPEGFAADCPGVVPNRPGVEDEVVVAGFWPNKEDVPPLVWLFWPNRLPPGGAPAGVVEGRKDVLFAAGVAVGVEPRREVSSCVGCHKYSQLLTTCSAESTEWRAGRRWWCASRSSAEESTGWFWRVSLFLLSKTKTAAETWC